MSNPYVKAYGEDALKAAKLRGMIEGRIEAFEFVAQQLETYISDNEAYKHRKLITKTMCETINAAASGYARDCRRYAADQRKDLADLAQSGAFSSLPDNVGTSS